MDKVNILNAEDFKEVSWIEFINAEGICDLMNDVFKKTGYTLKFHYNDEDIIERAYPVKYIY